MGIFSFLNRNKNLEDLDHAPPASQAEEEPKAEFPVLRKEMAVEVVGEDGQAPIKGLITERNDREITVGRCPGGLAFKLCEPGSRVVVRGSDSRMMQFSLWGTVAESSRLHIRLKDLVQKEVHENLRETFRLTVNTPISVFDQDDEQMALPKECILVDISTGGCCISSKDFHEEGEVLRLRIQLEDYEAMDFVGEVIRVTEYKNKYFRCGILFAQLKKEEIETLTGRLFHLQVGSRQ